MKSIVVYSSVTGNTKMVAEAIAEKLGAKQALFSVEQAPIDVECDLIAVDLMNAKKEFGFIKEKIENMLKPCKE